MNDKLKSACAYIRVSTEKQEELSPASQKKLIIEYCQKNGYVINESDFYEDLGISASKQLDRPQFKQMIAMCKSKEHPYDAVIVWKFSRFARSQEESRVYKSMLKRQNVDVISVSEPIADDFGGRLVETVIEWMDEFYSINLSQEVMRGMKESALRGKRMSCAPYGYVLQNGELIVEPTEAETIKYFFSQMAIEENSVRTITYAVNQMGIRTKSGRKWEDRSVRYVLQNPVYIGKIRWNYATHGGRPNATHVNPEEDWIIADGKHEPIISEELFNIVQEKIKRRSRKRTKRVAQKHWLSGTLKCSICGSGLSYHCADEKRKMKAYFVCQNYSRGRCSAKNSRTVMAIEDMFFEGMQNALENAEYIKVSENVELNDPRIGEYEKQISVNERRLKRIQQAYIDEIFTKDEYLANKAIVERDNVNLKERLQKCLETQNTQPQTDIKTKISNTIDILKSDSFSVQQKQNVLSEIIEKIVYDKATENMDFHFKG